MGEEKDCISNKGAGSKDETWRAKSDCDTISKPCHQLLVEERVSEEGPFQPK